MARGHFEVFPTRHVAPAANTIVGEPTGKFAWRFVDEDGKRRARSEEDFDTAAAAKRSAGDFVISVRESTYGLRFSESIADAVREVDE